MSYTDFKSNVLGKVVGDGQCVALSDAYAEYLNPGVQPYGGLPALGSDGGAKDLAGTNNEFFSWIANDVNNPNQVPSQGDIMVFGSTPAAGYTNSFDNPYGHTGICDSASSSGYELLQQNAPNEGEAVNVTYYPWNFRPCLGWLVPLHPSTTTTTTTTTLTTTTDTTSTSQSTSSSTSSTTTYIDSPALKNVIPGTTVSSTPKTFSKAKTKLTTSTSRVPEPSQPSAGFWATLIKILEFWKW